MRVRVYVFMCVGRVINTVISELCKSEIMLLTHVHTHTLINTLKVTVTSPYRLPSPTCNIINVQKERERECEHKRKRAINFELFKWRVGNENDVN